MGLATIRARRSARWWAVAGALAVVLGVVLALVVDVARAGGPVAWMARRGIAPAYVAQGRLVEVEPGRQAYVDCRGSGSPTVVFEGGLGTGATGWGFTFPEVSNFTRACAWDRPGLGRSEGRGRHTARDTADDLRRVLAAAGESPPFVVVGHSLGGVYGRVFAAAHRDDVAGLVLVDPFTPDINPADAADVALPPGMDAEFEQGMSQTFATIESVEDLEWPATDAQLRASALGNLPLELVFVDQRLRWDDRVDVATETRLVEAWERLVTALSTESRLTIAEGAGHVIQIDRPEYVIDATRRLVERSRRGD